MSSREPETKEKNAWGVDTWTLQARDSVYKAAKGKPWRSCHNIELYRNSRPTAHIGRTRGRSDRGRKSDPGRSPMSKPRSPWPRFRPGLSAWGPSPQPWLPVRPSRRSGVSFPEPRSRLPGFRARKVGIPGARTRKFGSPRPTSRLARSGFPARPGRSRSGLPVRAEPHSRWT